MEIPILLNVNVLQVDISRYPLVDGYLISYPRLTDHHHGHAIHRSRARFTIESEITKSDRKILFIFKFVCLWLRIFIRFESRRWNKICQLVWTLTHIIIFISSSGHKKSYFDKSSDQWRRYKCKLVKRILKIGKIL